jgi:hypothetical protein
MVTTRVLTLFDPDNKHEWCDTRFNNQTFIRIINSNHCHDHIRIHVTHPELDVHFFFPNTHAKNVKNGPSEYINTIKYIYCCDKTLIKSTKQEYGRPFSHKVCAAEDLEFEIKHVQVALFHSLAKQEPEESNQRDTMISIAIQELDGLQHDLKQMMTDQLSEQPVERH